MPFNDLFVLDVAAELERQCFNLVVNNDSQMDMSATADNQNAPMDTEQQPAAADLEAPE